MASDMQNDIQLNSSSSDDSAINTPVAHTSKSNTQYQDQLTMNKNAQLKENSNHAKQHEGQMADGGKHDKSVKPKLKKKRELEDLNDSQILSTRLRSDSGKVYSTSVTLGPAAVAAASDLQTVTEEGLGSDYTNPANSPNLAEMAPCHEGECCKNFSMLVQMITKLQKSVDGFVKETGRQQIVNIDVQNDVEKLRESCNSNADEIVDLSKDLDNYRFQLQKVSQLVIRQEQQIGFLNKKVTEMQQREMNPNIVITGIVEQPNEKPIQLFNQFVMQQLEIQELIPANQAFRIGNGTNRPLIVELRDPNSHKGKLFAKATKLKGKKNKIGKPYFLADHLPEALNEERRRINDLMSENKKKPRGYKLDMTVKRGKLTINEEPYCKAINAPTAEDILNPPDALYDLAKELDVVKGGRKVQDKSTFVSYAVAVQDHQDIQAAYLKLRMKHTQATHVVCAFRLPGANTPVNQDFVDDREYGAGRVMLRYLKDEQVLNVAIFLVRYHGGINIGSTRFEIFKDLAKKAKEALMKKRVQEEPQNAIEQLPDNLRNPPIETAWADAEQQVLEEWNQLENWNQDPTGDQQQQQPQPPQD